MRAYTQRPTNDNMLKSSLLHNFGLRFFLRFADYYCLSLCRHLTKSDEMKENSRQRVGVYFLKDFFLFDFFSILSLITYKMIQYYFFCLLSCYFAYLFPRMYSKNFYLCGISKMTLIYYSMFYDANYLNMSMRCLRINFFFYFCI